MTAQIVPDEFALHTAEAIALTKPERELATVTSINEGRAPMNQHRRPRTRAGRLLTAWWIWPTIAGLIIGATLYGASDARADGILDHTEADYVIAYGAGAICPTIDQYHSAAGVMGVARSIITDGFTADSAVDIINEAVSDYCPRNWPLLVAIGDMARASQGKAA